MNDDRLIPLLEARTRYIPRSHSGFHGLLKQGLLTRVKVGGRSYVRLSDLQRFIAERVAS